VAKRGRPQGAAPADAGSVDAVLALVRQHGGRVTSSRRLLLSALFDADGDRTAEELTIEVQSHAPDVHLSTIYRNLEELERLGVIVHTHLGHGPATYHLAPATHGHFVCDECGEMIEVPGALFDDLSREATSRYGFTVDPHHFAVLGRCRRCRRENDR
jgi:Fur family transcriptional regulator, ferric uptake regulator